MGSGDCNSVPRPLSNVHAVLVMTHPSLKVGKNSGLAEGRKGSPNASSCLREAYHPEYIKRMKSEASYRFIVMYLRGVSVCITFLFHKSEEAWLRFTNVGGRNSLRSNQNIIRTSGIWALPSDTRPVVPKGTVGIWDTWGWDQWNWTRTSRTVWTVLLFPFCISCWAEVGAASCPTPTGSP